MEEGNCNPSHECLTPESSSEMGMNAVDVGLPVLETADQNNNSDKAIVDLMDQERINVNSNQMIGQRLRTRPKNRRLFPEKIHHKRQTLQDMARPLKRWLYENRDNPYPTKQQKQSLAVDSHMSLVQISNWFANARRRVKNVVKKSNVSWSERVELYNQYVEGDAELFSISSEDEDFEEEEEEVQNDVETFQNENTSVISHTDLNQSDSLVPSRTTTPLFDQRPAVYVSTTIMKHKQTILQRYFNDNAYIDAVGFHPPELVWTTRDRHPSGSLGSQDYEEMSTSSASSRIQHRILDDFPEEQELPTYRPMPLTVTNYHSVHEDNDMRQKEMDAVFALTSLANSHRSKLQENYPERSNFRI